MLAAPERRVVRVVQWSSVIRAEPDHDVLHHPLALERGQNPPDLRVHRLNHRRRHLVRVVLDVREAPHAGERRLVRVVLVVEGQVEEEGAGRVVRLPVDPWLAPFLHTF